MELKLPYTTTAVAITAYSQINFVQYKGEELITVKTIPRRTVRLASTWMQKAAYLSIIWVWRVARPGVSVGGVDKLTETVHSDRCTIQYPVMLTSSTRQKDQDNYHNIRDKNENRLIGQHLFVLPESRWNMNDIKNKFSTANGNNTASLKLKYDSG